MVPNLPLYSLCWLLVGGEHGGLGRGARGGEQWAEGRGAGGRGGDEGAGAAALTSTWTG